MKKEEIALIAQLLTSIREVLEKLEKAEKEENYEEVNVAKKEIANFQKHLDTIL